MNGIHKCFMLEPSDRFAAFLRRYVGASKCASPSGYHNVSVRIGEVENALSRYDGEDLHGMARDDPRWPAQCSCGYVFQPDDKWQHHSERLWRRADTGELVLLRAAPPGAMWYATWYEDIPQWCGPDGRALMVKTPGGDWHVDSTCGNCDSPCKHCGVPYLLHTSGGRHGYNPTACKSYEDARPHACWVRHGVPPMVTVDKRGVTCGAGAGSIQCGPYHGFLVNGNLQPDTVVRP